MITKKKFTKMSKARRAVFIAKDVLEQLRIGKFISTEFLEYVCLIPAVGHMVERGASAKEVINDVSNRCYVCAKGATIASYVRHFNEKKVTEVVTRVLHDPEYTNSEEEMRRIKDNAEMRNIFGENTWQVMENAFEGWKGYDHTSIECIMKNIIRNKGVLNIKELIELHEPRYKSPAP